jgi:O-antigen/teichoic acid export membrane protein
VATRREPAVRTGVSTQAAARTPLPPGTIPMGVGLVLSGIASYAFLALAARGLGPEGFAPLSVLWATLFVAGPGLFQPVEQELSRSIASRVAAGRGFASLLHRARLLTVGLFVAVLAVTAVLSSFLVDELFSGEWSLLVALVVGVGGYAISHIVRGRLAGTQDFGRYAQWFGADALVKAIPCAALVALSVTSTTAYAAVLAVAAYAGAAVAGRGRVDPGPPEASATPWGELTRSMGHLLATSLAVAALLNAGTVAVELLAGPDEADRAGIFLTGLVIARVPLFFYQAVQASLLPRLTALATEGRFPDFRRGLYQLLGLLGVLTVLTTAGALVAGSWAVGLLFGPDYRSLTGTDMATLALSSMLAMAALTLGQALIALHLQARVWWPWLVGLVVFAAVAAWSSDDLFVRVEAASVASALAVLVLMAAQTVPVLRRGIPEHLDPDDVIEALHELPLEGP